MTSSRHSGTYLDRIIAETAKTVESARSVMQMDDLEKQVQSIPPPPDVMSVLDTSTVGVIAEFKRASPSRGPFTFDGGPAHVANDYVRGGCVAISCLTDEPFFHGSLDDLQTVVTSVEQLDRHVPVLRKDFTIDRYQIAEARAFGASIVLLITAILSDDELTTFREYAESLGMVALVEVHDELEASRALFSGARLVGVNNRDLRTFNLDLSTTERLAEELVGEAVVVGESGIFTRDHVERMAQAGCSAVLVGESVMTDADRSSAVSRLAGVPRV